MGGGAEGEEEEEEEEDDDDDDDDEEEEEEEDDDDDDEEEEEGEHRGKPVTHWLATLAVDCPWGADKGFRTGWLGLQRGLGSVSRTNLERNDRSRFWCRSGVVPKEALLEAMLIPFPNRVEQKMAWRSLEHSRRRGA